MPPDMGVSRKLITSFLVKEELEKPDLPLDKKEKLESWLLQILQWESTQHLIAPHRLPTMTANFHRFTDENTKKRLAQRSQTTTEC
jgi:hypothetical protein